MRDGARGSVPASSRCLSGLRARLPRPPSLFSGSQDLWVSQGRPSGGSWVQAGQQPGGGRLGRLPLLQAGLLEPGDWSQGLILGGGHHEGWGARRAEAAHRRTPALFPSGLEGGGVAASPASAGNRSWTRGPWFVPHTGRTVTGRLRGPRCADRGTEAVVSARVPLLTAALLLRARESCRHTRH